MQTLEQPDSQPTRLFKNEKQTTIQNFARTYKYKQKDVTKQNNPHQNDNPAQNFARACKYKQKDATKQNKDPHQKRQSGTGVKENPANPTPSKHTQIDSRTHKTEALPSHVFHQNSELLRGGKLQRHAIVRARQPTMVLQSSKHHDEK